MKIESCLSANPYAYAKPMLISVLGVFLVRAFVHSE